MTSDVVGALVALGLISFVVTLMTFPFVERSSYLACRPPRFVAGVVFMPLFVAIGVTLGASWSVGERVGALLFLLAGFWGSAAWLYHPSTQGDYVAGLEFGPELSFRPDLVLPGGVTLVKGLILTGIGMMLALQEAFKLPVWNWWGFVLAFFGIITIIPIRGMSKMLARRSRFLGGRARWQGPVKVGLLVVGLSILLHGFLSAFMGFIPFVEFRPRRELAGFAVGLIVVATIAMALREWWKRGLQEGTESMSARYLSALWLYLSIVVFMYAAVLTFMGKVMTLHPDSNPVGFGLGLLLVAAGATLAVWVRPWTLRRELDGAIRVMVGNMADMGAEARWALMTRRMRTIASYPLVQCAWHLSRMNQAISSLSPPDRAAIDESRLAVMSSLSSEDRRVIMEAMDRAVA